MPATVRFIPTQVEQEWQSRYELHKRGLNTKQDLAVDSNGMFFRAIITQATTTDCTQAKQLINEIPAKYLLGDKRV